MMGGRPPICALIVTYHPDLQWPDRLAAAAAEAEAVVVVDNCSDGPEVELISRAVARAGAHLIRNDSNRGLAAALNQGALWTWSQGFRWLLLLDQDTQPLPGIGAELLRIYHLASSDGKVAVVGSNFSDLNTGQLRCSPPVDPPGGWIPRRTVITSGALIAKEAFDVIGPFREEFFVDSVDHDFCLRARSKGFQVVMATRPLMRHTIGSGTAHAILGTRIVTSNHSSERRYYMARNRIVLAKQNVLRETRWVVSNLWGLFTDSVLMLLVEDCRLSKARCVMVGVWHGLLGKLGPKLTPASQRTREGPC